MHNGSQIAAILQLQNRINNDFKRVLKENLKGNHQCQIKKFAAKAPLTPLTLPLQCDLRLSAARLNSITHAAAARSNLDAAIPLRSADTELQNTIELCTTAHKLLRFCSSKTGSRRQSRKTTIFEARFKRNFKRKIINAKSKNLLPKHH